MVSQNSLHSSVVESSNGLKELCAHFESSGWKSTYTSSRCLLQVQVLR